MNRKRIYWGATFLLVLILIIPVTSWGQSEVKRNSIYVTAGGHNEGAASGLTYEYSLLNKRNAQLLGRVNIGIFTYTREHNSDREFTPFVFVSPVLLVGAEKNFLEISLGVGHLDADNFLQNGTTATASLGWRHIRNNMILRTGLSVHEGLYGSIGIRF